MGKYFFNKTVKNKNVFLTDPGLFSSKFELNCFTKKIYEL